MKSSICLASSWNVVLVVRPQPGQAVTLGLKARRPSDCRISSAITTSWVRASPGFGEAEVKRIVAARGECTVDADQVLHARHLAGQDDLLGRKADLLGTPRRF